MESEIYQCLITFSLSLVTGAGAAVGSSSAEVQVDYRRHCSSFGCRRALYLDEIVKE